MDMIESWHRVADAQRKGTMRRARRDLAVELARSAAEDAKHWQDTGQVPSDISRVISFLLIAIEELAKAVEESDVRSESHRA